MAIVTFTFHGELSILMVEVQVVQETLQLLSPLRLHYEGVIHVKESAEGPVCCFCLYFLLQVHDRGRRWWSHHHYMICS